MSAMQKKNPLYVNELPLRQSKNAKVNRIDPRAGVQELTNLVHHSQKKFIEEYIVSADGGCARCSRLLARNAGSDSAPELRDDGQQRNDLLRA